MWGIHRGPVNSPHKWPVTRKMFSFDDVIMDSCLVWISNSMMASYRACVIKTNSPYRLVWRKSPTVFYRSTAVEFMTWWNNYMSHKSMYAISYTCPNCGWSLLVVSSGMILTTWIILCKRPANKRRHYNVTSSLIGWVHTQNPCDRRQGSPFPT